MQASVMHLCSLVCVCKFLWGVRVRVLLCFCLGSVTAEDKESSTDAEPSPNDGRLNRHLDRKIDIFRLQHYVVEVFVPRPADIELKPEDVFCS